MHQVCKEGSHLFWQAGSWEVWTSLGISFYINPSPTTSLSNCYLIVEKGCQACLALYLCDSNQRTSETLLCPQFMWLQSKNKWDTALSSIYVTPIKEQVRHCSEEENPFVCYKLWGSYSGRSTSSSPFICCMKVWLSSLQMYRYKSIREWEW